MMVTKRTSGSPLVYIYLDKQSIESLYAQITDRVEREFEETRSRQGRGEVGVKLGFGNVLSSLLGVREVGAETKLEGLRGHFETARSTLTVEHKVKILSDHQLAAGECHDNLRKAATDSFESGHGVYVRFIEKFDSADFYPGNGGVGPINASQAMVFTIENQYDPSDSYFKSVNVNFVMAASLSKFTRLSGAHMGATSHDAIMFRAFKGKGIPLGVFGHLMCTSNVACQIKPFAIWLLGRG